MTQGKNKVTLKKKDLIRITNDYLPQFPGWRCLGFDTLIRENGPILQGILFNRASSDVYKPMGFIHVLCSPSSMDVMGLELPQSLKHKNGAPDRAIGLSNHERLLPEVVADLRKQILPQIDKPLEPIKVLDLYLKMAVPTLSQAESIAALQSYFGFEKDAKRWIGRFRQLFDDRKKIFGDLPEFDNKDKAFIDELEAWLVGGMAKQNLTLIIEEERRKFGLLAV